MKKNYEPHLKLLKMYLMSKKQNYISDTIKLISN